ncbi:MAG: hypothetical protein IJR59_05475 [Firmicutes bacterium]|nr:hypothetical protein [Bacillota bacterium]
MDILNKIKNLNTKLCTKYVGFAPDKVYVENKQADLKFDETKANDYLFGGTKYYKKIIYLYDSEYGRIVLRSGNLSIPEIYDEINCSVCDKYYDFFDNVIKNELKRLYGEELTISEFDAILTMAEEVFNELFLIVLSADDLQYNDVLVSYIMGFYRQKDIKATIPDRNILNYCFTMTGYNWEGYEYIEFGSVSRGSDTVNGLKIKGKNLLFADIFDVFNSPTCLSVFENNVFNNNCGDLPLVFELSKEVFNFGNT